MDLSGWITDIVMPPSSRMPVLIRGSRASSIGATQAPWLYPAYAIRVIIKILSRFKIITVRFRSFAHFVVLSRLLAGVS